VRPVRDVSPQRPGRHNDLTDVAGIRVGHHDRRGRGWLTGTTVVLPPAGTVGSVDVRGGGPSTRETDALAPTALVDVVHAVVLSGGSSYGLAAATGVMEWLAERNVGFGVGERPEEVVPIVAAACLFDLGAGGRFASRPDAAFAASGRRIRQGSVGAGTGAHAGALKGGIGSASVVLPAAVLPTAAGDPAAEADVAAGHSAAEHSAAGHPAAENPAGGITVAALVAVNPGGSVIDPATGEPWGARHLMAGEIPGLRRPSAADLRAARADGFTDLRARRPPPRNTVLAVVATDAALNKSECARLAAAGHDGMARAIRPVHTMTDGDVVFSLATGTRPLPDASPSRFGADRPGQLSALMGAAADTVARAVVHAVLSARSAGGMISYLDRYPSARS
jgi:L-aminopeptidase/D-esterase-like protein